MIVNISVNLLVVISVDRLWAVCHPTSHQIHKNSGYKKWMIVFCVGIAAVLIIRPPVPDWKRSFYKYGCLYDGNLKNLERWIYWSLGAAVVTIIFNILNFTVNKVSIFIWSTEATSKCFAFS